MSETTSYKTIAARVDQATAWRSQRLAQESERSLSGELRRAVDEHLERAAGLTGFATATSS
jgi:hypothetical protein